MTLSVGDLRRYLLLHHCKQGVYYHLVFKKRNYSIQVQGAGEENGKFILTLTKRDTYTIFKFEDIFNLEKLLRLHHFRETGKQTQMEAVIFNPDTIRVERYYTKRINSAYICGF